MSENNEETILVADETMFSVFVGADIFPEGEREKLRNDIRKTLSFMLRYKPSSLLTHEEVARVRSKFITIFKTQGWGFDHPLMALAVRDLHDQLAVSGSKEMPEDVRQKISREWFLKVRSGEYGFRCEETFTVLQLSVKEVEGLLAFLREKPAKKKKKP